MSKTEVHEVKLKVHTESVDDAGVDPAVVADMVADLVRAEHGGRPPAVVGLQWWVTKVEPVYVEVVHVEE